MAKHTIPLETSVSFGTGRIYVVDQYQDVLGPCSPDCVLDHDCYEEAYITVREQSWTAFPLSELKLIFDENGFGRLATEWDKKVIDG